MKRVSIDDVDWGSATLLPLEHIPAHVVPITVNGTGDPLAYFTSEKFDGFVMSASGGAWWACLEDPGDECNDGVACYDLRGDLHSYKSNGDWLLYDHDVPKPEEKPVPEQTVEQPKVAPVVQLEDLSNKPFDPIAVCEQKERMRQLYDSRATVNIPWIRREKK